MKNKVYHITYTTYTYAFKTPEECLRHYGYLFRSHIRDALFQLCTAKGSPYSREIFDLADKIFERFISDRWVLHNYTEYVPRYGYILNLQPEHVLRIPYIPSYHFFKDWVKDQVDDILAKQTCKEEHVDETHAVG